MKQALAVLVISACVVACGGKETATQNASTPSRPVSTTSDASVAAVLPAGHPPIPAATEAAPGAAAAPSGTVTGSVAETFDAGGYTYLRLKTASGEEWAAIRQTVVKKNATVKLDVQMVAENFKSSTLKRTFPRIIFGALAGEGSAPAATPMVAPMMSQALPPGHPSLDGNSAAAAPAVNMPPMNMAAQHMSGGSADNTPIRVAKAEGPDGRTVATVWAQKATLKDQPVEVRGKVVKFLGGIMGKNWIHLRDGSGSASAGDFDLTVTTADMANVGDVVIIKGVVRVDKDFGAGYRYDVIVEDAKISK